MERGLFSRIRLTAVCSLLFAFATGCTDHHESDYGKMHLDLETSSAEYQKILKSRRNSTLSFKFADDYEEKLNDMLAMGARNLEWLNHINSKRDEDKKISFSSKDTQRGIPITEVNEYNPKIIYTNYLELLDSTPDEMKKVVVDGGDFTDDVPVDLEVYITYGRALDRAYQGAARWFTLEPYLGYLTSARIRDIRGYYFLSNTENLADKLKDLSKLGDDERAKFEEWLIGICYNTDASVAKCQNKLSLVGDDATAFYKKYVGRSKMIYDSYFKIPNGAVRKDILWNKKKAEVATIPFLKPSIDAITEYLTVNIEDEWKYEGWQLRLDMQENKKGIPYVRFEEGVTPHVNQLGGNEIVMDANAPLSEYDVQWTIRHEFGHVIGLPDCYLEYYDSDRKTIVGYQIDVENLMCSRRGHMNETIYNEVKGRYLK